MHSAFSQILFICLNLLTYIFCLSLTYTCLYRSIFTLFLRSSNNKHENNQVYNQGVDFERVMYADEFSNNEDIKEDVLPLNLKRLVKAEERQILPHQEATENVNLGTEKAKKEVNIGTSLSVSTRKELIDLLKEYVDVFAWSYQDMPSLDTDIVVHCLPLREECPSVKRKLRRVKPKMLLKIKEEVRKQ